MNSSRLNDDPNLIDNPNERVHANISAWLEDDATIGRDLRTDLASALELAPAEDPPAPAVEIRRPTPIELLQRWELRPVARWSASPLPTEMSL